jgi:hypothetical protein
MKRRKFIMLLGGCGGRVAAAGAFGTGNAGGRVPPQQPKAG